MDEKIVKEPIQEEVEETQSDEAFYPSEETMKQMEVYENLGKELLGTYNDLYLQFKMYRK